MKVMPRTLLSSLLLLAMGGALAAETPTTLPSAANTTPATAASSPAAAAATSLPGQGVATVQSQGDDRYVVTLNTLHMGTLINIKTYGKSSEEAQRYAQKADELASQYDDLLTVHRESPLMAVNEHSGEKVAVPAEIAELVRRSVDIAALSNGAFEPTIGTLVNVWKIGFGGEHVPSSDAIRAAVKTVDYRQVKVGKLDDGRDYVQIGKGQSLDLGGSAKGFIGEKMQEVLEKEGLTQGILSLGGNVVAMGTRPDGTPWRIGLQHPDEERNAYFGYVLATDESVITSGAYERYFVENGHRYGHILDAKTGQPVKTDVASVSIAAKDGTLADGLCTALFAMGWEKSMQFLKKHPDMKIVLLNADMKTVAVTPSAKKVFVLTDKAMTVKEIQ